MEEEEALNDLIRTTVDRLVEHNTLEFNHLKAIEELNELATELTKKLTKSDEYKPTDAQVIGEIRDVILRVSVLAKMYDPDGAQIAAGLIEKMVKLNSHIDNNEYPHNV